ncbi:hypothetical protein HV096_24285 [Citrobacter freundii]|nr:hypothetical protein [Citrobacter freundii]EJB8472429.1 hypothetical protein [Citrobacter freundii]EJB8559729.1 hypothetical protein [Citrobacter freundii]MBA8035138.1 hypothetical protein [Citrobacter freundii]QLO05368.1 hypothetical protein HV141_18405 [Citrobacter freundii]QLU68022.1 hypothetical protein HV173_18340 [Citrobacter freundii]
MLQTNFIKSSASIIHNKKVKMDKYWNTYTMSLLKQIVLTENTYYHQVVPCQNSRLMITLFGSIQFDIIRTSNFGNVTIDYQLHAQGLEHLTIPSSSINEEGLLDGVIPLSDKTKVFEHYLTKLKPLYRTLSEISLQDNS